MSAIIKKVYDAFIDAGASEQKATEAAKALANYDARFNKIDTNLLILKWMVGLIVVVSVLPMLREWFLS